MVKNMKRYNRKYKEDKDYFKKSDSELPNTDFAIILPDGTRLFRMDTIDTAQTSIDKLVQNLTPTQFNQTMQKLKMRYPGLTPSKKKEPQE